MALVKFRGVDTRKCLSGQGNLGLSRSKHTLMEGTSQVKRSKRSKSGSRLRRVVVSADGAGVVSHAGVGLLRELAEYTGLVDGISAALLDTYQGPPQHAPGRVFTDIAVAVADGADAVSGIRTLRDRADLHGPVASTPTAWRLLDRIDEAHLPRVQAARADARAAAWAAGAGPDLSSPLFAELVLDFDATITVAHSDKENAAATWKRTFGFHPLLCFLDRPDLAAGEGLAGLLRPGNAGSNTAADHITVLDQAIAALPAHVRPQPASTSTSSTSSMDGCAGPAGPRVLARSDSAGATHAFAAACRQRGVGFSFGFPVDARVQRAVDLIPEQCWSPAIDTADPSGPGDGVRDGAWVAEATGMLDLSAWPQGSRLLLRKERPHPGAQLTFTDADGLRVTAVLTDTEPRVVPGQVAGLELRHRQHARVEDRIRQAKATGLRNLPCREFNENAAWLQAVLTATDLVVWAKKICFADLPALARCEIAAFRYRVLHVAARITRSARTTRLRVDSTWAWAQAIATGWQRLRDAFP